ncbi:MAG: DMT family transporter [Caldiserica bacterium]|jgi:drug/metabolite transporter (DMT)-like permease|nr:DMT family transporter [Caldisericota bacterium]MDH7562284.1 DMT family transporter [Caldisericota bacterium]
MLEEKSGVFPASRFLIYLSLAVGVLALSMAAFFVRWANAPGIITSFYRMAIATVLMALPFSKGIRGKNSNLKKGAIFAVLGGVAFAFDLGLWTTGVMMGEVVNPTLLANTAPLWVGLGTVLIFKRRLKFQFWLGVLLALGGAAFLLGVDISRSSSIGLGSLLGLLAGLFYAAYWLLTQKGREYLDSLTYFWIAAISSTAVLTVGVVLSGEPLLGYPFQSYLAFFGFGLITQVVGWMSLNYALGHVPASLASPTLLGQPLLTGILAWPLLGEALSLKQVLAGISVLIGIYIVHRSHQENQGAKREEIP